MSIALVCMVALGDESQGLGVLDLILGIGRLDSLEHGGLRHQAVR